MIGDFGNFTKCFSTRKKKVISKSGTIKRANLIYSQFKDESEEVKKKVFKKIHNDNEKMTVDLMINSTAIKNLLTLSTAATNLIM